MIWINPPRPPHLSRALRRLYIGAMMQFGPFRNVFALALAALALSCATGLAFAGWMQHGDSMFLSLVASGLSLCF